MRHAFRSILLLVALVSVICLALPAAAQCPPGQAWFKGKCRPVFPEGSAPTPQGRMMVVTATALNMRSCPSLRCGVVGVLHNGQVVEVFGSDNGFSRVTVPDTGATGWTSDRYLAPTRQSPAPGSGRGRPPLTEPRYDY